MTDNNSKASGSANLDFKTGFGYMCHLDNNQKAKMFEGNGVPESRLPPESLDTILRSVQISQVTQGTQAGIPSRRPRPLLHHSSEYILSKTQPLQSTRQQSQKAFYTNRSGQPYLYPDPLPYTGYLTTTTRSRRRPYLNYPSDSPTSSLDCLTLKDNNISTEAVYQGKMNERLGPSSGASSRSCQCCCRCGGAKEPEPPGPQSAEGLSWRRLHMSRAKLKATATTSELLSGFAMIAMVELQINEPTNVPEWLFVMFAVCTTVLVAVHIFALMISTYLLPTIDAVSKMSAGDVLRESPHERMRGFIELAWAFSTVLGLFLFLIEIAILCWVKFWDYSFVAATAATVIVIPVLIVFVAFAVHFYHSLVVHKCEASDEDMEKLEDMKRNLDSATSVNSPV